MRAHLGGIAALIYGEGLAVYDTNADRPTYNPLDWTAPWTAADQDEWELSARYAILTAPTFEEVDAALARGEKPDLGDYFRLTLVAGDAREVRALSERMRGVLNRAHPVVEGYSTLIRARTPGVVSLDRSAPVNRTSGTYPALAVDTYRYDATPA